MLLLTRRIGESVVIGEGVEVRVMNIQGGQVRLGIDAPLDVQILRSELLDRKKRREDDDHAHR